MQGNPDGGRFESTTFALRRVKIETEKSFDEVVRRLETEATLMDPNQRPDASGGIDQLREKLNLVSQPNGFVLLGKIDHLLLERLGREGRSIQYAIGNPLIAADITAREIGVGLYAPFRLGVFENAVEGGTTMLFDDPADLMGSFGDDHISSVGQELSRKIRALLLLCI